MRSKDGSAFVAKVVVEGLVTVAIAALAVVAVGLVSHSADHQSGARTLARVTSQPQRLADDRRRRVLFAGDTLLGGYGASAPAKAFRARVVRALGGTARVDAVDA